MPDENANEHDAGPQARNGTPGPGPENPACRVPGPASGAPGQAAPAKPRLSPEALEALRAGRRKRRRIALFVSLMAVAAVMAVVAADGVLSNRYWEQYHEQPWLKIMSAYSRIEQGTILAIHRNQAIDRLEKEMLSKEVYAIGFVTSIEQVEEDGNAGLRLIMDAPNFIEPVNLFEDDVRVDLKPDSAGGLAPGQLVIAFGTCANFSKWGLWISGGSARPLTAVERWYVRKALPPTRHTREAMGFNQLLKEKEKNG